VASEAAVGLTHRKLFMEGMTSHDQVREELSEPVRVFEELGDEAGLARAIGLCGQLRFWAGQAAAAIEELERSAQHAQNAGDRMQEIQSLQYIVVASLHGPATVTEALNRCAEMRARAGADRRLEVVLLRCQGHLEAMRGNTDTARTLLAEGLTLAETLGLAVAAAAARMQAAEVELLAGDPAAAERIGRPGAEALKQMGNQGHFVSLAPILADALVAESRYDEAAALIDLTVHWAMEDDLDPQIGWRRVRARLLAHEGDFDRAEQLVREATALATSTDFLLVHARAREDLAEVLRLAGRPLEAAVELEHALQLHEAKGNVVAAARTREKLTGLSQTAPTP
jgi:ATP/maltotriose-dependent transcriptional regulator MalT